mmetsp:Transcript_5332/g.8253  ORF Transcript_5332/g.8253 Transcript_5332/m.8253 type:complete len:215 (+) Transcript_5332:152-796(+)|eukprot:CAMPEP_0184644686 /NCGR_PEP_ID=MMETSP0308-20130426/1372_1 /TAXON_ID=38269 /ORGANISM="Gloeochaete witrockiana, Strain SAG 46.84" /LENGTH=214 /DNA_ID=CAMNT_0027073367 /DNA_START=103 /DNA_END=747 /DNA_ORIENTATION=-
MAEHYKIHYFNIRGRAEAIRLLLEDAGIRYEEERLSGIAHIKSQLAFGQVPLVEENGYGMTQTIATLRYLASKPGVNAYPSDLRARYICDMVADGSQDWRAAYTDVVYTGAEWKAKYEMPYIGGPLKKYLSAFEALLAKTDNGSAYFSGKEIAFCDYLVWELIDINLKIAPSVLDSYPLLNAFHKRIASRPRIAAYVASGRRPTRINGAGNETS